MRIMAGIGGYVPPSWCQSEPTGTPQARRPPVYVCIYIPG
jgi:hypothetical protein